jgi:hypothetical protein
MPILYDPDPADGGGNASPPADPNPPAQSTEPAPIKLTIGGRDVELTPAQAAQYIENGGRAMGYLQQLQRQGLLDENFQVKKQTPAEPTDDPEEGDPTSKKLKELEDKINKMFTQQNATAYQQDLRSRLEAAGRRHNLADGDLVRGVAETVTTAQAYMNPGVDIGGVYENVVKTINKIVETRIQDYIKKKAEDATRSNDAPGGNTVSFQLGDKKPDANMLKDGGIAELLQQQLNKLSQIG